MKDIKREQLLTWQYRGKSFLECFWEKVIKSDGCWIWNACRLRFGYGIIGCKGNRFQAHRCSWVIHYGDIPEGMCVLHKCDVPYCVNPKHLWLGTYTDNNRDMARKGRRINRHGEEVSNSKLTTDQVLEIHKLLSKGWTKIGIANKFGVSDSLVCYINNGKAWKHIHPKSSRHLLSGA